MFVPSKAIPIGPPPVPVYVVIVPVGVIFETLPSSKFAVHMFVPSKAIEYGLLPVPVDVVIVTFGTTVIVFVGAIIPAAGVNVAVYTVGSVVVARPESVPFDAVTSLNVKAIGGAGNVNVAVAICPSVKA